MWVIHCPSTGTRGGEPYEQRKFICASLYDALSLWFVLLYIHFDYKLECTFNLKPLISQFFSEELLRKEASTQLEYDLE